jgi:tRNASer (uridine44-2'-O)-methyltransferase
MAAKRPMFEPSPCCGQNIVCSALSGAGGIVWVPVIHCPASFPPELVGEWMLTCRAEIFTMPRSQFEEAVSQLVHHPEYNSTLILRSETLSDSNSHFPSPIPRLTGSRPVRTVHRKLLPRRPGRDASLEQFCTLYSPDADIHPTPCSTLVLTPITHNTCPLPYYHPTVSHLAFRYILSEPPVLRVEVVPLSGTPMDMNSRLYRTCLALLDTLHRYGWGVVTKYKKRIAHDCLVPREAYQDLYLVMRERHKHMVKEWQEVTDPLKHVFEASSLAPETR